MCIYPLLFEASASKETLVLFEHTFLNWQCILSVSTAFPCWFDMQNGRIPNPVLRVRHLQGCLRGRRIISVKCLYSPHKSLNDVTT